MERIAALVLSEKDRLIWRKRLTAYFRETGDWTPYMLPPSIILPGAGDGRGYFDVGDGIFHHGPVTVPAPAGSVLPVSDSRLPRGSGLFISKDPHILHEFGEGSVKVSELMILELDGGRTRIVRRKPLRLTGGAER